MKYQVVVRPEAEEDLKEAFSWYEDNRTGLGYDFLLHVDAGINFIKRHTEIIPYQSRKALNGLLALKQCLSQG